MPAFPERETADANPSPEDATALDGSAHDAFFEGARDATVFDGEAGSDAPHDAGADAAIDAEGGCGSGQAMCGDAGVCDDLSTDVRNCGACGTDCTRLAGVSQGSTITCKGGRCAYSCLSGYADCADAGTGCISLGVQMECGACGVACDAGSLCSSTSSSGAYACTMTCPTGTTACGSTCVDETTNAQPNAPNCGGCGSQFACTGGKVCVAGACACPSGQVDCGGTCTNTMADSNNCGACTTSSSSHICPAGTACNGGSCACTTSGLSLCGGACINETSNAQANATNCGGCGSSYACSGGKVCVAGACACPFGETDCGGACTNTMTDNNNCGACTTSSSSHACPSGTVCSSGGCVCTTSGLSFCGGACVNETTNAQSNATNCGGCGSQYACTGGEVCVSGSCACPTWSQPAPFVTIIQGAGALPTNWLGGTIADGTYYATSGTAYGNTQCANAQFAVTLIIAQSQIQSDQSSGGIQQHAAYSIAPDATVANQLDFTFECGTGSSFTTGYTATSNSLTFVRVDPLCGDLVIVMTKQ